MDEATVSRFHQLRGQALRGGVLTAQDTDELAAYMRVLEDEEQETLRPAHADREAHLVQTEQQIFELRQLVARREALAAYLRRVLDETNAERAAIDAAFHRLMEKTPVKSEQPAGIL
jgi:hypothetical protein